MATTPTNTWTDWLPFSDLKGFVRLAIGVSLILLALKLTGLKRFVA